MRSLSFYFAIVCCVISQMFIALELNGSVYLKFSLFVPLFVYILSSFKSFFCKRIIPYYLFLVIFALYCASCEAFVGVDYLGADINNICISIFTLSVSFVYGKHIRNLQSSLNKVAWFFFVASFAYGIAVYFKYLVGADMFSVIYAYGDKNSAAQIYLSASIILFTLYKPIGLFKKLFTYFLIVLLLYFMFILKSRATLLGFFFVICYFTFAYKNKKVRYLFFISIIAICLYVSVNPLLYRTIVEGILFANRDAGDLNSLSSGRVGQLTECVNLFFSSPIIGIGNKYFDCFPVIILTQYGILGATIVFAFLWQRIKDCFSLLDRKNMLDLCAYLLMITYLLDSLFEAQPPFGPGVKCFPLWMIWGIMLSRKTGVKYNGLDGR